MAGLFFVPRCGTALVFQIAPDGAKKMNLLSCYAVLDWKHESAIIKTTQFCPMSSIRFLIKLIRW